MAELMAKHQQIKGVCLLSFIPKQKNENKESGKYFSVDVNFVHFFQLLFSSNDKHLNKAVSVKLFTLKCAYLHIPLTL